MDYQGHILYGYSGGIRIPLGIVSCNHERKAKSAFTPVSIKRYIVQIEDRRFYNHKGIDFRGVARAIVENAKSLSFSQGGSTITQQLSRNIMRDNRKSLFRKMKEAVLTLELEANFSKEEILEQYFSEVFWGKNIYGLRAASLSYFAKEPHNLTSNEQLHLVTLLRGPNYYLKNPLILTNRLARLNTLLHERGVLTKTRQKRNLVLPLNNGFSQLEIFKSSSVNYLEENINSKTFTIQTSIISDLQNLLKDFIAESKSPTSILCLYKGKVVGVASSFGTAYPFEFKTNVGSTLKPFVYDFLRMNGVEENKIIDSTKIFNSDWPIKEATAINRNLSISEALLISHNKTFVNACYEIGMDKVLDFLSLTLEKERAEFYPSSILGATKSGLSLYDLACCYYHYYQKTSQTAIKKESLNILQVNAKVRLGDLHEDVFLKTGTTNRNKESIALAELRIWFLQ